MGIKISKLRFLEYGKKPPQNSRFTGVMNTESLIGYSEYMNRDEAKDDEKFLSSREGGYIGYTTSHHKSFTMSSLGMIRTEEDRKKLISELSKAYSEDGDIFYENVISIQSHEEASKYGLDEISGWNEMLVATLPQVFRKKGFDPSNMLWFADFHVNTEHPHIHLIFLEKNRTQSRAIFSPSELRYMKRKMYTHMSVRRDIEEKLEMSYRQAFKKKDVQFKEILSNVVENLDKNISLNDLRKNLPKHGRLQYDSENMKDYRKYIDLYIKQLIDSDEKTRKSVEEWMNTVKIFTETMEESDKNISTIQEAEMKKLYRRVGNMILRKIRDGDSGNVAKFEEDYEEVIVNNQISLKDEHVGYKSKRTFNNAMTKDMIQSVANIQRKATIDALREFDRAQREKLSLN